MWKVYRERAEEQDQDQLRGWNQTLDILLIFVSMLVFLPCIVAEALQAALFSAVATAFIIESCVLCSF